MGAIINTEPFEQLVGSLRIYLGRPGTPIPDLTSIPDPAVWEELGPTDGDQKITPKGDAVTFHDNNHQGIVKAVRPVEDLMFSFTVVSSKLEKVARILNGVHSVIEYQNPNRKKLGLKRGRVPVNYAMLLRGEAHSPYGNYPAMYVIPLGFFMNSPEPTYGKNKRVEWYCEFGAIEDDEQPDEYSLGWLIVQTS